MDERVDKMIQAIREKRPNWREASEHDIRIRFVVLLAALEQHRHDTADPTESDLKLWRVLDNDHL